MIANKSPIFKVQGWKRLKPLVDKFKNQVMYIESTLIELGLAPEKFDLGRDDCYQFFEFHIGTAGSEEINLVEKNYHLLVNKSNTPLVMSLVPYIGEDCKKLHLCFYLKVLSINNPFRYRELEHYLYYFNFNEMHTTH